MYQGMLIIRKSRQLSSSCKSLARAYSSSSSSSTYSAISLQSRPVTARRNHKEQTKQSQRIILQNETQQNYQHRHFTTTSSSSSSYSFKGEKLRVAVVGGGCAGLSTALHLADLVEQGLISGPIDIYQDKPPNARSIGVGVWSTALDPFRESNRPSHQLVYKEMTQTCGTWLGGVGYRVPNGTWLMKSHLPTSEEEMDRENMPALLFLREADMIKSLQKAIHLEEHQGTVKVHRNHSSDYGRVHSVFEESSQPWSTNLVFSTPDENKNNTGTGGGGGKEKTSAMMSERDYHLIIAADGTHSALRQRYGGHDFATRHLTGTSALPTSNDIPSDNDRYGGNAELESDEEDKSQAWDEAQQSRAVGLQDRNYTVFRGNAVLSDEEMGVFDEDGNEISFQTWGEGRSMRFATVPMRLRNANHKDDPTKNERQVWFITIDDDAISSEPDPVKRRDMLLETFQNWHDPVCRVVAATPAEEILMERAIAHRHNMGPVLSLNKVVKRITGKRPPNAGEGPCIVFVGDAYMTVDPILAQGFTVAMEAAYVLGKSVGHSCRPCPDDETLAFDPSQLRRELKLRHHLRMDRLISLLRATELVQALGQPTAGKIAGWLNTKVLRSITKLTPNFIKKPVFDSVLKYSLGLGLFQRKSNEQQVLHNSALAEHVKRETTTTTGTEKR